MKNLCTAIALAALVGCAPATVDTVQPNTVSKSVFVGEWYHRDTVVDAGAGNGGAFIGRQSELERLTWRVEQEWLLGSKSYETVADSEGTDGDFEGGVVVAYRILKHFDIRRSYNRVTGEESNVIEENTERAWFDREYMRVDWSKNHARTGLFDVSAPMEVLDHVSTDPESEWAPSFDDSDGDGIIDAINLYRRVIAAPESTRIPGYGEIPVCFFYGKADVSCEPLEIVVGSSMIRVDETRDYEGLAYDDRWMETFGYFSEERLHYDREYAVTQEDRVRWPKRHNLWKQIYKRDAAGRILCSAGERQDACAEFLTEENPRPVTISYRKREVRPIVYHVGAGLDPKLRPQLSRLEAEWNEPFRDTINQLRFWECMDAKDALSECSEVIDPELQAFVVCPNNPSLPGDPDVCNTDHTGADGRPDGIPDEVRIGDLRYHLMELVDLPQRSSPFGYGPSSADPSGHVIDLADGQLELGAGEIISANAFLYGAALDRISASTADLVGLINGTIDEEAFVDGENVGAWVTALRAGQSVAGGVGAVDVPWNADALQDAIGKMDGSWATPVYDAMRNTPKPTDADSFETYWELAQRELSQHAQSASPARGRAAWEAMIASPFDEMLWNDETVAASGIDPALLQANPGLLSGRSPLDALDPSHMDDHDAGLLAAGQQALDLDDGAYTNPALIGRARRLAEEGLSHDEIIDHVREELFFSVMLHEIGHTVGLRHNFAGSNDAWNFHPEYWNLRDDGNMGPRHVDPETPEELEGGIREYQYSTVMDYPGNTNGDWHGLGRYDHAAIKFGYGKLVEVMTDVPDVPALEGIPNRDAVNFVSLFYNTNVYPMPILGDPTGEGFLELHYTDYPALAGDLEARVDVPLRHLVARGGDGVSPPAFDEYVVTGQRFGTLVSANAPVAPYRFCSDEFATGAMCARFDEGVDPYEITRYYIDRYFNDYVIDNFARGRYGFGFGNYPARRMARTFRPLQTWARYYALFHGIFGAEFDADAEQFFAADKGLGGWTAGTVDSMRFLGQVIARPEPGSYTPDVQPDGLEMAVPAGDGEFDVELGQGAYYASDWDDDGGYFWFERRSRVGTYWDKMIALQMLTSTDPYDFVGFDTASDPRAYSLGFATLWPDEVGLMLGGLVSDDPSLYAPARTTDGQLRYPDPTDMGAAWPPDGATLVEPGDGWLIRYAAGLFGNSLLQSGFDHTFLNRARIYEAGGGDAWTAPSDKDVVTFTDPQSSVVWSAWRYPGEDGLELGAGARLLDRANTMANVCDNGVATPSGDADEDAWQQRMACSEVADLANDVQLQSRIQRFFDGRND